MTTRITLAAVFVLCTSSAFAQAVGGAEKGRPVTGDPGISSMVVMDRDDFRVLRDWAEPGAVRRMHQHADATYHVVTLVTGQLVLTIEGQPPVDVKQGDVVELKGGVMHTFKNTGTVTATIVEVFGKARKPAIRLIADRRCIRPDCP
jgi:quercetin dioxygenase-like cupin family protein